MKNLQRPIAGYLEIVIREVLRDGLFEGKRSRAARCECF